MRSLAIAASSCRYTWSQLPRVTRRETSEKRAAELGSYVRHVWVLDYIYIPMPCPVYPGWTQGADAPIRAYNLPHVPFHSLVLDRDPSPSHPSLQIRSTCWGIPSSLLKSSVRPRAHTRVINLSVRVCTCA